MTAQEIKTRIIQWVKTGIPFNVKSSNMRALLTGITDRLSSIELGRLIKFKGVGNSSIDQQPGDIVSGVIEDVFVRDGIYISGNVSLLSSYIIPNNQGGNSNITRVYDDIPEMLADQINQNFKEIYLVTDASGDPDAATPSAVYVYKGVSNTDLDDYIRLSSDQASIIQDSFAFQTKKIARKQDTFPPYTSPGFGAIWAKTSGPLVEAFIFDVSYSGYLAKARALLAAGEKVYINYANTTKGTNLQAEIIGFEDFIGVDVHTQANLNVTDNHLQVLASSIDVNNTLHLFLPYMGGSGGQSLFLGTYTSLPNLTAAHPSPLEGSKANIDAGVGDDVREALWDNSDNVWILRDVTTSNEVIKLTLSDIGAVDFEDDVVAKMRAYLISTGKQIVAGVMPVIELSDGTGEGIYIYDRLITDTTVTGTYVFNLLSAETWRLTMVGNTSFSIGSKPPAGFTKTITAHLDGNFAPTWSAELSDFKTGSYDGDKLNTLVIEYVDGTMTKVQISQND